MSGHDFVISVYCRLLVYRQNKVERIKNNIRESIA